jgi:3-oxoacyl-[acyl-carrier-protein] synthase-3/clorobiocin biosynthesis protein CloN2
MRFQGVHIRGIGVFLPDPVEVKWAVAEGLYPAEDAEAHGWKQVRVAGDIPAPEMALSAARAALKDSGDPPGDVDLLFYTGVWHQGPATWPPQYHLQRELIGGRAFAAKIDQGCNGMFGALELAAGQLTADPDRRIALLVATDNFGTALIDRWNSGPGFILGDAASALVLGREPGFAELLSVRSKVLPELTGLHRGAEPLFPPGATIGAPVSFRDNLAHFAAQLEQNGADFSIFLEIPKALTEVVDQSLAEAGITREDVTRVACMNDSREVVEQRLAPLGLPLERSAWEYGSTIGHTGASDPILALADFIESGQVATGDHVLLIGVGPGVTIYSAVIRIRDLPHRSAEPA